MVEENEKEREILFFVKGDELSDRIKKEAKNANFQGDIVSLTLEEARFQRTPLPLLFAGNKVYGPTSLTVYFRTPDGSESK